MKKIFFVGGSKGGIGKSFLAMALVDLLLSERYRVLVIETDNANSDVGKIFNNENVASFYPEAQVTLETLDLDISDGWSELFELVEKENINQKFDFIVINSAARNDAAIADSGEAFVDALKELAVNFTTLWVINNQRDSMNALRTFIGSIGNVDYILVKNLFFAPEDKFDLVEEFFNASTGKPDQAPKIAIRPQAIANLLKLDERFSKRFYNDRMSLAQIQAEANTFDRNKISRWRAVFAEQFKPIVDQKNND